MTIKNANEIERLIADNQYKYLELISRNKKYGGYNATPKDLKNKVTQVKKFLSNLPDDVYFLNFRISPRGDTFTYQYTKGNPNLSEPAQQPVATPIVYNNNPVEKFQTIDEWKRQEKRIAELERELELLKITSDLKTTLNENKEPEKNVYLSFAENVLPSVLPIVDKFFALKEREIGLRENQPAPIPTIIKQKPKMVVPNPGEPGYNEYLQVFEKMSDLECENELNRLQKIGHPAYNDLITRFYESQDEV